MLQDLNVDEQHGMNYQKAVKSILFNDHNKKISENYFFQHYDEPVMKNHKQQIVVVIQV
jgi:hypothetical protein